MVRKIYARRIAGSLYEFRDGASSDRLARTELEAEARRVGASEVIIDQTQSRGIGEPNEVTWHIGGRGR